MSLFGLNINPAEFIKHQVGYAYLGVAEAVANNKATIVADLPNYIGQGAAGLKSLVANTIGTHGVLGLEVEAILDKGIDNLDANALAQAQNDAPGFVDSVVAKLKAHAQELLAG